MQCRQRRRTVSHDHIWCQGEQFRNEHSRALRFASPVAIVHLNITALRPSQFPKSLPKSDDANLCFWIALSICHQNTDAPHALALLRTRRERPSNPRAAEQRDELAAPHVGHGSSSRRSDHQQPTKQSVGLRTFSLPPSERQVLGQT
jgi:hypothetical protein